MYIMISLFGVVTLSKLVFVYRYFGGAYRSRFQECSWSLTYEDGDR